MAQRNNWLRGTTIRKSGPSTSNNTRTNTPQLPSTSKTIYGGGVQDPSGRTTEYFSMDDKCPICDTDRYLKPHLRLLVSPCYHRLCESCIDRLYTLGPAPCPTCNTIQRKLGYTPQTFEDLTVEREVAVRRRIAKEFNKRREDFPDLRSYNDYLEEVEEIAFNLINDIDVAETEARIARYRQENAALIKLNQQREEEYQRYLQEQEEMERQERELRAQELRRIEEEEREEREKGKQAIIDKLETSDKDAARLVAKSRMEAQRRASARAASSSSISFSQSSAHLLRTRATQSAVVPDVPHIPLQDDYYAYDDMFKMQETYHDPVSDAVRRDKEGIMRAGGYQVNQAWERALRFAVAGLDIAPLSGMPTPPAEPMAVDPEGPADVVMASA
ncbi:CDK-activating kinase assembly factor [Lentinus tigrinus ALCF2SS1-7]|uniref:RNA polymerase II transcription factor B subunit 3 n=1 Tax=Lentinus tigrinus ALCF2SS1-6 TaxID=1328759 RepID=A0A5C2SS81_9APHY|nr:CDK-activating kinase assembly factor [Lentinus tigrinus ALCF2SS1-6]RPD79923.1 CDK-activating kinase assembly factor [Lentinus tigrinus ALCF2SS1-7]